MKAKHLNDENLLSALKSNPADQDKAIRQLCFDAKIRGSLFNFIKTYHLEPDVFDDILQDALIILIQSIQKDRFRAQSKVSTFLIGITRRLCQEKYRETRKTIYTEPEKMSVEENTDSTEFTLIQLESEKQYTDVKRRFLAQLSEKCRKILLMAASGYSREEIAEEMEWTNVQTAKNSVPECRKRLRKMIEADPEALEIIKSRL
ncbi:MAG: sigma-70 family RNA polymerase sigma factor [Saprospiraceae bacterium]|nr:sigma-70 family RNA polymerase sigma factor [Saprospiraceae bacterium]MCB9324568.1 sigma-70 family RNA polymerase sigma factor [Lewinellaceae bacterium]